ncbi:hypothetical protein ASG87_11465 [Frateuria sp. Soil773]|uniref:RNA polymerase sigma factor n=1 Tax=Frateuria sp. Soil773 TaxID=1736407 RepID=UPI0006F6097B|nr:RNA polymerase sigma factor [Frateuria sp. Soil773]KRF02094.1 hypothetical protein ASG87_11465 [Frateuria sp. Soil773]
MAQCTAETVALLPRPQDAEGAGRFERFLGEQREALVGFLRHRTASEADAQDAAQESMVRLMRYRERQPVEAWKPLLYRIAINVVHDQARRRQSRHGESHQPLDEEVCELPADEPTHEQRVAGEQELAVIRELILRLPERCRQVYLLNRIEGMSYSEIARHCGISVKAVEKHVAKALVALRKGLGERGYDAYQGT